jgi:hypothetical protein
MVGMRVGIAADFAWLANQSSILHGSRYSFVFAPMFVWRIFPFHLRQIIHRLPATLWKSRITTA